LARHLDTDVPSDHLCGFDRQLDITTQKMNFLTPSLLASIVLSLLAFMLLGAAWSDIRSHRIPNKLVFPGACLGLLLNTVLPEGFGFTSALPGAVGFWKAATGLGLGLAIFLPFYLLRAMGAGDVKLMAMVGAFLGPNATVENIVMIFLVGGVLTLIFLLRNKALGRLFRNIHAKLMQLFFRVVVPDMPRVDTASGSIGRLPFGTAIAAGSIIYFVMARNGVLSVAQILRIS
jgi:prepilin peptidase CpaA